MDREAATTRRVGIYAALSVVMLIVCIAADSVGWRGNAKLHTIMELVAALVAFSVGLMALLRFYSKKDSVHLLIGVGFLSTAGLDCYHAVVTASLYDQAISSPPSLIPWSWNSSRIFLAILMCLSWWTWRWEQMLSPRVLKQEVVVYLFAAALMLFSGAFFASVPPPAAYGPNLAFPRPEELLTAVLFAVALFAYIKKGGWKDDAFEHWIVCSLIFSVFSQAALMSRSRELFDAMFDLAHLFKILSYGCVFVGSLISMVHLFHEAEASTRELLRRNRVHQQRAEELRESRLAALRMMRETEKARRDAEQAQQELWQQALDLARANQTLEQQKSALDKLALVDETDARGRITYANDKFCEVTKFSREELIGKDHRIVDSGCHPESFFREMWQTIRAGRIWQGEIRNRAKDGSHYWVDTTIVPYMDDDGRPEKYLAIRIETTERKRMEEALRKESNFVASVLESQQDCLFVMDSQGMILRNNTAADVLLGYERGDLLGSNVEILFPPELADEMMEGPRTALEGKVLTQNDVILLTASGERIPVQLIAAPIRDGSGQVVAAVGVGRDLREQKRAEAELAELNQQLIDSSRRAGMAEIATGVLHNVGNVLNSVNVAASLTVEYVKQGRAKDLQKVVAVLDEHADNLGEFITRDPRGRHLPDSLKQLSNRLAVERDAVLDRLGTLVDHIDHIKQIVATQQADAGVCGILAPMDLADVVEDALKVNAAALECAGVELRREYQPLTPVNSDRHKILQILVNLIANAENALTESGLSGKVLTVRIAASDEEWVRVEVQDNGVGISEENLTKVFQHAFTTRKSGHGFGLHASALAVKELGGTLIARSDGPGHGAVFTLEIPAKAEEPVACTT